MPKDYGNYPHGYRPINDSDNQSSTPLLQGQSLPSAATSRPATQRPPSLPAAAMPLSNKPLGLHSTTLNNALKSAGTGGLTEANKKVIRDALPAVERGKGRVEAELKSAIESGEYYKNVTGYRTGAKHNPHTNDVIRLREVLKDVNKLIDKAKIALGEKEPTASQKVSGITRGFFNRK